MTYTQSRFKEFDKKFQDGMRKNVQEAIQMFFFGIIVIYAGRDWPTAAAFLALVAMTFGVRQMIDNFEKTAYWAVAAPIALVCSAIRSADDMGIYLAIAMGTAAYTLLRYQVFHPRLGMIILRQHVG